MPSRKGSPNKNKAFLLKRLQEMYGRDFHPILCMAENANKIQELIIADDKEPTVSELRQAIEAWDKVAQYTTPKLKAVELTGEGGNALTILIGEISGNTLEPTSD